MDSTASNGALDALSRARREATGKSSAHVPVWAGRTEGSRRGVTGKGTKALVPVHEKRCMTVPGVIHGCKYPAPAVPRRIGLLWSASLHTVHTSRRVDAATSQYQSRGAMQRGSTQTCWSAYSVRDKVRNAAAGSMDE